MIGGLLAAGYLLRSSGLDTEFLQHWIDHDIRGKGWLGEGMLIGVFALLTAVGFPRQAAGFLCWRCWSWSPFMPALSIEM